MVAAVTAVMPPTRTPKRLTATDRHTHPGTRGLPARAAQRVLGRESRRRGGAYGGRRRGCGGPRRAEQGCGESGLQAWGRLAELGVLSPELTEEIPSRLSAGVADWFGARCQPPGSPTTNVPGCSAARACPFSINPLRTFYPGCA